MNPFSFDKNTIMDWFSRYVLAWQLPNTLDGHFCLDALQQALLLGTPDIFNTDQGVQFTALAFTDCLQAAGVRISMDGRGRAFDNIFIERLWRSLKYEDIYLKDYDLVPNLQSGLTDYFQFYNHRPTLSKPGLSHPGRGSFCLSTLLLLFTLFFPFRGLDFGVNLTEQKPDISLLVLIVCLTFHLITFIG